MTIWSKNTNRNLHSKLSCEIDFSNHLELVILNCNSIVLTIFDFDAADEMMIGKGNTSTRDFSHQIDAPLNLSRNFVDFCAASYLCTVDFVISLQTAAAKVFFIPSPET